MPMTRVILVGGFLGAGKTTLLMQAAQHLASQGKRVGLVANDQAADLVDTELLKETGSQVEEVTGGCFCCRFPDMVAAMQRLVDQSGADVLIGEPVGSCTDLSATVMQPLKRLHRSRFDIAPFSVLIDVKQVRVLDRLRQAAQQRAPARFPDDVLYIYEKQLEEADLIVLNKADLIAPDELDRLRASLAERFPHTPLVTMSALSGDGVEAWLALLEHHRPAGGKIAEVNYDTYAAGEAALGWLNAAAKLRAAAAIDWQAFATGLLEDIRADLRSTAGEIAHLKLYLTAAAGHIVANLTSNDATLALRGHMAGTCRDANMLINARVHANPEQLRSIVERRLQAAAAACHVDYSVTNIRSFFPGRPQPTYRDKAVV